jgi:regulator of replication initiation timing
MSETVIADLKRENYYLTEEISYLKQVIEEVKETNVAFEKENQRYVEEFGDIIEPVAITKEERRIMTRRKAQRKYAQKIAKKIIQKI